MSLLYKASSMSTSFDTSQDFLICSFLCYKEHCSGPQYNIKWQYLSPLIYNCPYFVVLSFNHYHLGQQQ